ncbi:MAG: chitobiase/beta-hexosaminidase C-terminal domain-containing protein [Bacteroidota bacterium]
MAQSFAGGERIALSQPQVQIDSVFFLWNAQVSIELAEAGVEIRYTTDGSEVEESSPLYKKPLEYTESTLLRAKAWHPNFQSSESITVQIVKLNPLPAETKLTLSAEPNTNYPAQGAVSLIDGIKGPKSFRAKPAWLGFLEDSLEMTLTLPEPMQLSGLQLSLLEHHGAWIFLPERIEVLHEGKVLGQWQKAAPTHNKPDDFVFPKIGWPAQKISSLSIRISPLQQIPDWHGGAGKKPWLFIDELIIQQD